MSFKLEIMPWRWVPSAPLLPVHHGVSVESHEKHLAASSGSHRCKKYLFGSKKTYLLNYFYYCKKKPVNCLGEQGQQELPHTLWFPLPKPPSLLLLSSWQQKFYMDPLPGSQFSTELQGRSQPTPGSDQIEPLISKHSNKTSLAATTKENKVWNTLKIPSLSSFTATASFIMQH